VTKISCTIQNRGRTSIYLLNEDPVLEGPRAPNVPYIYRCTGCGRYGRHENTLQYNRLEVGTLDLPVLFHPTIHLHLKDVKRLVRVEAGAKTDLKLTWQLERVQFPSVGEWLIQLKMIYLSADEAGDLLQKGALPPVCHAVLAQALGASGMPQNPLELVPFREADVVFNLDAKGKPIPNDPPVSPSPRESKGSAYNGCYDVISERFQDVFSATWVLRVSEK
jgi:hypothetical protein